MKGLQNITVSERNKGICQQPFCAIANYVVAGRFSFARNLILAENTQFRSSQQTQSGETLAASVADDTTDNKQTEKQWTKCQRFVKLKELQADTRANAFAAHLILPNRTQSPPTTRQVDG